LLTQKSESNGQLASRTQEANSETLAARHVQIALGISTLSNCKLDAKQGHSIAFTGKTVGSASEGEVKQVTGATAPVKQASKGTAAAYKHYE